MAISSIVRDMRSRMPWDVGKRIFASNEIPKSHGWDKTLERIEANEDDLDGHADGLSASLMEHYICGEKLTRFYRLRSGAIDALREKLAALARRGLPANMFSRVYPNLLDKDEIDESYPQEHTLASIETNDHGIAAVFASLRAIFVREPIETEAIPQELVDQYDEIVGLKLQKFQAMDVVWVPHRGRLVDIRIDFPRGMHHDQGLAAEAATKNAFHQLIGEDVFATPVNLFPLIQLIYEQQNEGHVVELAFGTTTASLKHEKMRRRQLDLRRERYHMGGKRALTTPIEPYRLSVEYQFPLGAITSFPELSLNGTSRMTGATNPVLFDAAIRKCIGVADYEHVRSRIAHFIRVHRASSRSS